LYGFKSRIRYSEVDENGILTIGNAINYFQDCSTFQSEELGVGVEFLKEQQTAWILNAWQIEINRLPRLGEEIVTATWPYAFKGMYGYRNFIMEDQEKKRLLKANSIWVYYDMAQKRPKKVSEEECRQYTLEEPLLMEYLPRKISVAEGGSRKNPIKVKRHLIDTNHHVNNGRYIQLGWDYLPQDFQLKQFRAEYRKAAVLENEMIPRVVLKENGYFVVLEDKEGKPYVNMEFIGEEKR